MRLGLQGGRAGTWQTLSGHLQGPLSSTWMLGGQKLWCLGAVGLGGGQALGGGGGEQPNVKQEGVCGVVDSRSAGSPEALFFS